MLLDSRDGLASGSTSREFGATILRGPLATVLGSPQLPLRPCPISFGPGLRSTAAPPLALPRLRSLCASTPPLLGGATPPPLRLLCTFSEKQTSRDTAEAGIRAVVQSVERSQPHHVSALASTPLIRRLGIVETHVPSHSPSGSATGSWPGLAVTNSAFCLGLAVDVVAFLARVFTLSSF